jgi:two-component system, LytTR family, sensor kinase
MKRSIDSKVIRFYLWVALAYSFLWLLNNVHNYPGHFWGLVANNLWRTALITVLDFIFFEYTVQFVTRKRNFIVFNIFLGIITLFAHLMLWSFGMYGWRELGIALGIYTDVANYEWEQAVEAQMAFSVGSIFFFGILRHIYKYTRLKQAAQQLQIEKQAAELSYLKSQTNPHFLFNTLNNIYSLTRDKSDLAPESILRLSKILRYMLYEAGGTFVAIDQELKIINDYIELEKLRYDESLLINLNHDIENMKQAIPPLLLIPLVENAFKHGVSETRGRPFIDIHLSVNNRNLVFIVKNSSEVVQETIKENIGLSNLRRQLELLYKEYNLSVQQVQSVFTAILKINLASHV